MGFLLLIILIIAIPAFCAGYNKAATAYATEGPRILIGLLCAVGCVLLAAAIFYGACLCVMSNFRLN